ncbi:MAG: transposase [Novosphingobium sp.]|nr:transposase [Novosphingobium sp.]
MPRLIELEDNAAIGVEACCDALLAQGFDPRDEGSLANAARQLRRLGNDRDFLAELMLAALAGRHRDDDAPSSYGPQSLVLGRRGGDFFLRANIWPSREEPALRASGEGAFIYGLPHDHNFSFLTLGYFGPGYWSDYYEYDYGSVAGWRGEPVGLRFVERARLSEGRILLYRAHRDVHAQLPADALSVSLNVMHVHGAQGWLDQYRFDLEQRSVAGILGHGASEAFLRIAVGLGGEQALDLAHRFARHHPSDRMRLHACDALASVAPDAAAREALWRGAERAGSRLVAMEAKARLAELSA